jgi:hypothetical protein
VVVALLVVVGCLLAPLSVLSVWIRSTLLDTDRYVATVGPVIDDPEVQQALATRITTALVTRSDAEERIADVLPEQASFVAPAVANALGRLVEDVALDLVRSDVVERLWDGANRRAHTQVVALLEGETRRPNLTTERGEVVVNLAPLAERVRAALDERGIDLADRASATRIDPEIVLVRSETLDSAQQFTDLLQKVAYVLPIVTLLTFAVAIALSGNRRRTVARGALGVALALGLLLVAFNVGRHFYLGALPPTVNEGAAAAVYDQILSFLRLSLRTAFVAALVIALGAWVAGPGAVAARFRAATIGRARAHGAPGEPSAVAVFVGRHRTPLRVVVGALAVAALAAMDAPTPATVVGVAALAALALLVVELVGRPPTPAEPTTG